MSSSKDLPPSSRSFFSIFIHNQFHAKPQWPPEDTDLSERVAIVTGANVGLGFECSRQLLSHCLSHLILAVRSLEKGEAAASELRTQYPKSNVELWALDMASYDSITAFAKRVDRDLQRLDIAILNAGLVNMKYNTVPTTGHEETMQVDYISTVLLSILLLPALKAKSPVGSPGRLAIVNAALSLTAQLPTSTASFILANFDRPKTYDAQTQYNMSKMLAHMYLYKLSDYVSADDVIVNLADPAYVKGTQLARDAPTAAVPLIWLFGSLTGRTKEVGASTFVDAAVIKGKESHGCFLMS